MTAGTHRRAENVESIAAITPMQQGILFHSLEAQAQDPYFLQRVFAVNGPMDASALQRAWQLISDRHQVLRADYRWEEAAKPAQVIFKTCPVELARASFRALSQDEQRAQLRHELAKERAAGFDFRRAAQLRLSLIELSEERYWLVWSYHHIALDGWSAGLVLRDVLTAYHALTTGRALQLPDAGAFTAYVDFVHQQDPIRAASYWSSLLAGAELPSPLPRSRNARPFGYSEQVFELSRSDSELLRDRARALSVTQSTLVQGAWALLLGRCAELDEVVFGTTVSGRSAELRAIDATAGLFINTLPSRIRLTASTPVARWLADIQAQSLESRRYEHTPLGEIRRAAAVAGDQNLFDSVVVFENFPLDEMLERQPSGLSVQSLAAEHLFESGVRTTGRNNYALTLNVIPAEQLVLTIAYQCDQFEDDAIAALGAQLAHLLRTLGARPEARIGELGLQVDAVAAPGGGPKPRSDALVLQSFMNEAQRMPAAAALRAEARTCTYEELDAASNRLARELGAQGVRADDRVGLHCDRSIEFVIGLLAVWKAGAAYVPLDPKLPAARREALERSSGLRLSLDAASIARLSQGTQSTEPVATALHPEQAAYVIFTSGSTGSPKGVVVSHGALARYTHGVVEQLGIEPGASMAMVSTVGADLGHTVLFGSLASGGVLHMIDEARAFDPDAFAEYMAEHAVQILKIVPSHLAALLHAARPADVLPAELLILGGEASDWTLAARVRTLRPATRVVNHYGPTEATVGAAFHALGDASHARSASVPIGVALPDASLEVLDRDLNRVPPGTAGELFIGGGRLARGYLGAPAASAARFIPNPYAAHGQRLYRTGDRVKCQANGELEFLGRVDRQIKLRGYRVELGDIESKLREHPAVRAAAVVPKIGASGAQQLAAYAVAREVTPEALLEHLRLHLPDYMLPARVALLSALPLTRNGKLDVAALPVIDDATRPVEPPVAAAASDVEHELIEIWQQVLRVERVGVADDFFKLGGDSILSLQVVARARRRGLKVTPQQIFERRTLRELAQVATAVAPKAAASRPAALEAPRGSVPLLPIQARFFAREQPEPSRFNQSLLLRARDRLDAAQLRAALAAVVGQHDALRLRFRRTESGAWEQGYSAFGAEQLLWERSVTSASEIEPIADEAHGSLDLSQGPLLRAVLFEGSAGEQRLLLVIHHLAVDGVSWRVLLEDLQASYRGLALPAKTTSVQLWSKKLSAHASSDGFAPELPYWFEQLEPCAELPARDHPQGHNLRKYERRKELRLGRDQTARLLRDAPEHFESQSQELLLTALARALCGQARASSVLIELESHGREDLFDGLDLSRTVGWFTSVFPLRLTPVLGGRDTLRACVRAVSAQLRSVPQRGIGYGALSQLASEPVRARLRGLATPRVTFNYLGQFDASFDAGALLVPAREPDGNGQSDAAPLANWLTITGQIYDGELQLSFGYSSEVYESETIDALVRAYQNELAALLAADSGS